MLSVECILFVYITNYCNNCCHLRKQAKQKPCWNGMNLSIDDCLHSQIKTFSMRYFSSPSFISPTSSLSSPFNNHNQSFSSSSSEVIDLLSCFTITVHHKGLLFITNKKDKNSKKNLEKSKNRKKNEKILLHSTQTKVVKIEQRDPNRSFLKYISVQQFGLFSSLFLLFSDLHPKTLLCSCHLIILISKFIIFQLLNRWNIN